MCLDLLTGESRWEQQRGSNRYVAGIHKDRAIIVSNTAVHALNLSDGFPSWGSEVLTEWSFVRFQRTRKRDNQ